MSDTKDDAVLLTIMCQSEHARLLLYNLLRLFCTDEPPLSCRWWLTALVLIYESVSFAISLSCVDTLSLEMGEVRPAISISVESSSA